MRSSTGDCTPGRSTSSSDRRSPYVICRHDLPLTIRSTLDPLLGDRIHGTLGNIVDGLSAFGIATSLGLGTMQINAGIAHLDLLQTPRATGSS